MKTGLAIHCHHDILCEHCFNYDGRVEYIKKEKPKDEQEIRLRLFKLLPREAIDDLPKELIEAYAKWLEAYAKLQEVYAKWRKADRKTWHDKWCGCTYWNGSEIIFKEKE